MPKRPNVILIVAVAGGAADGALTPIEVNKHGKSPVHARLIERV